ncbi:hypothetical protein [Kocuria sp. LHG3120]|uniref:hypothetical protein n=1 Tax=Kocuria sp. LHG3120 TaxID=2804590 RepID=UPI003CF8A431
METNDTVMGLLAGSKLAAQTLKITEGSQLQLSKIFPRVEHIERFNLTTDHARIILENAETLLGTMAIPQILALHEDMMIDMLRMLELDNPSRGDLSKDAKSANVHERFMAATGIEFQEDVLKLFHLVRQARNTHIHEGRRADRRLVNGLNSTKRSALELWAMITKEEFPRYKVNDLVRLGLPELIGILALTKVLAEEANEALQSSISHQTWADTIVADWKVDKRPGNPDQQFRQITGLTRREYSVLEIPEEELRDAMVRAGLK